VAGVFLIGGHALNIRASRRPDLPGDRAPTPGRSA
jgi:hypothetical protein